ncbi:MULTISPECIES: type II toxin-antitoxin system RelE/ParE family toxin [Xenorhabdus]|uniref:Plasmid stabilization system n=1 Tax=Xenorhabdus doucetiae TaxID=351671 RepID=A0A068QSZ5_9GAMM|nr:MULTISPECIES: type II toxin-antitoxin system RelE/ParE family toxin [Xenorhabdus]MDC9581237.1 type II toxin-antitoxin system RelE/ParE family toxin [Xenorhabdus sp. PR6a]TYP04095.1 hypothetical protein LY16_02269 [Xenorhabdus doucetiae]CDG18118.1 conserved protein of unknown function [Xenorhabdus doucetiae]
MTTTIKFEYSQTFQEQLYDRFHYLSKHIGQAASQKLLDGFIDSFENRIKSHPESAPLCEEAADIGLTTYHDYIDPNLQLRVIYRVSTIEGTVYALLFLSTKQSIRQALIRYCLRKE